ncbi:hypothetical protein HIJ39_22795 [Sulfobacillus sp. DSM 109850]|uniref:Uncharacterized protein n=1 Tax=Sulfobacillus harzensis TaxID=2729629 RepID=A0A7Y0Q4A7_9FIRM|nr:hypothetical protein [Sulfobacillus harzensis]
MAKLSISIWPYTDGLAGLQPGANFRGFHLATEVLGQSAELFLRGGIRFRSYDFLPSGKRGERRHPQIHADHRLVFAANNRRIRDLDGDTQEPAISGPGDRALHDFPDEPQGFVHSHPPQLRDMHLAAFDGELIIRKRKAIVVALLLERGIRGGPGEEILAICKRWLT